jgi:predicted acyltransferase (DUF342 family)
MGLTDLAWHGESGSDRGRDIVGQLIRPLIGGKNDISKWVVQCKRYTKGSLGRKEIDDGIIWAEAENPGYYLLITTSVLSSSNRDWLDSRKKNLDFNVELIDRPELEKLARQYIDRLQHYLPPEQYGELVVPGYIPQKKTTLLRDIIGQEPVSDQRPLKDRIFETVTIPRNTRLTGPIYGQSVTLEEDCTVDGHIYARRHVKIGPRSIVKGTVLCPVSIELIECEVDEACGSQVTMRGPCVVHGALVTERDLDVPPDSKVSHVLCSGGRLDVGERCEIGDIVCKGETVVMPEVNISGVLRSSQVTLRPKCTVGWISARGNIVVPEGTSVTQLATDGSVAVQGGVTRLHTAGDVEISSESGLKEITCRNLLASNGMTVENLRSRGNVKVKEGGTYRGKFLSANGDVSLPNDTEVETISAKGDVALGQRCHVKLLSARNLKALDNLYCSTVICHGSVELGEGCSVGSLQATGDIRFKQGLQSLGWTVFSEKGAIKGEGIVRLGDTDVPADRAFSYGGGSILTALTQKEQLELIEGKR